MLRHLQIYLLRMAYSVALAFEGADRYYSCIANVLLLQGSWWRNEAFASIFGC